jgi:hypothetical protein
MTDHTAVGLGLMMLVFGFVVGVMMGADYTNEKWRTESVEAGAAEYILEGSVAVWQWKETNDD